MRLRLSLLLVSSLFPIGSFAAQDTAETCTTVDLSKSPGLGEPLNRDGTGWCYGYVAADLVSFKAKQRVSAFDVSTNFHEMINSSILKRFTHAKTKDFTEGGNVAEALEAASGAEMCSEAELPSDYKNNDLLNYINKVRGISKKTTIVEGDSNCGAVKRIFPTVEAERIRDVVASYDGEKRIIELAKAGCKNRIKVPKFNYRTEKVKGNLAKLDEQLNNKNVAGIHYDMEFLFMGPDFTPNKIEYNHASTVVGRRFKNGKCEYQLKGSSGRATNYGYASPYRENNKGGYVWVDKESLAKFSKEITYVE